MGIISTGFFLPPRVKWSGVEREMGQNKRQFPMRLVMLISWFGREGETKGFLLSIPFPAEGKKLRD